MEPSDLRDRLARAEQDIKNQKENFATFKADDFGALKREVHSMRGEFNEKLDKLLDMFQEFKEQQTTKMTSINITLAKWMGAGGVLIFIGQLVMDKFIG